MQRDKGDRTIKAITYGQMRDALDALIKSGARKASEPMMLNGGYWQEIVDCRAKGGKNVHGTEITKHKIIARGTAKVKPPAPYNIKLV